MGDKRSAHNGTRYAYIITIIIVVVPAAAAVHKINNANRCGRCLDEGVENCSAFN